jgi:hypothetical protein
MRHTMQINGNRDTTRSRGPVNGTNIFPDFLSGPTSVGRKD